ncbi:hypothetical protein K493DRAFT_378775 [Basidiobolus meristosporus CBS 931.73]|uniref:RGS domain-containing protein n=1 Tax=Basidiobolus meristosporus CBS 931.73 TaxID=1314790 RepID=A0A1Y1Y082_9FUNG|nr:hypothetical protein K493DRAFT_378775 [Basidiobolus meristosporus CBS 931.73]|eukprot:ORX91423.1 hypothetical protein K493DRAFT_378775 [Basidiobolus meristosporus CBS 931.73]
MLLRSAAGIPAVVFTTYAIYLLSVLSTSYYFWNYRNHPGIRSRSIQLTFIGVVASFFLSSVYLVGPLTQFLPCFITLWCGSVLTPIVLLTTVGKFLRVAFLYRTSLSKLKAERQRLEEQKERHKVSSVSSQRDEIFEPSDILLDIDSFTNTKEAIPTEVNNSWLHQNSYIFEDRFLIRILGGFTIFHILVTVVIQCLTQDYSFSAPLRDDCLSGWEYFPVYVAGSCEIFVLGPIVIQYIRGVTDAYNIVKELVALVLTTGVGMCIYLIFAYIPPVYDVRFTVPVGVWGFVTLWNIHLLNCGLPLMEIYITNRRSKNLPRDRKHPSFEEVLDHPVLFEKFKAFSVKDFSVENTLFYERYVRLKTTPSFLVKNFLTRGLPNEIQNELLTIYNTFIREDSEYQVNLRGETLRELDNRIQEKDLSICMFETALTEVKLLMYQHTFKRYLQQEFQTIGGLGNHGYASHEIIP